MTDLFYCPFHNKLGLTVCFSIFNKIRIFRVDYLLESLLRHRSEPHLVAAAAAATSALLDKIGTVTAT